MDMARQMKAPYTSGLPCPLWVKVDVPRNYGDRAWASSALVTMTEQSGAAMRLSGINSRYPETIYRWGWLTGQHMTGPCNRPAPSAEDGWTR